MLPTGETRYAERYAGTLCTNFATLGVILVFQKKKFMFRNVLI